MRLRRWAEAERSFLDALATDPQFEIAMLMLSSLFIERTDGDELLNARKTNEWAEQALAIQPSATGMSLRGAAYYRLGEKDAAKEAYRRAIELDSSYEEAFFNLGLILADEGDDFEAEQLLRKAIELNAAFLVAHGRLGILLQKLGRYAEAKAEFKRCVEIDPSDYLSQLYFSDVPEPSET